MCLNACLYPHTFKNVLFQNVIIVSMQILCSYISNVTFFGDSSRCKGCASGTSFSKLINLFIFGKKKNVLKWHIFSNCVASSACLGGCACFLAVARVGTGAGRPEVRVFSRSSERCTSSSPTYPTSLVTRSTSTRCRHFWF